MWAPPPPLSLQILGRRRRLPLTVSSSGDPYSRFSLVGFSPGPRVLAQGHRVGRAGESLRSDTREKDQEGLPLSGAFRPEHPAWALLNPRARGGGPCPSLGNGKAERRDCQSPGLVLTAAELASSLRCIRAETCCICSLPLTGLWRPHHPQCLLLAGARTRA